MELAAHLRDLVLLGGETTGGNGGGGGGGGGGLAVTPSGGSSSSSSSLLLIHGTPSIFSPTTGPTSTSAAGSASASGGERGRGRGSLGGDSIGNESLPTAPASTSTVMGYSKASVMAEKSELLVSMLHHQLRDVAKRTAHPGTPHHITVHDSTPHYITSHCITSHCTTRHHTADLFLHFLFNIDITLS